MTSETARALVRAVSWLHDWSVGMDAQETRRLYRAVKRYHREAVRDGDLELAARLAGRVREWGAVVARLPR